MSATLHHSTCPSCAAASIQQAFVVKDYSISGETFALWRCTSCNFLFTQDPPAPAQAGRYYAGEAYISHSDNDKGLVNRLYHYAREYMLGRKAALVDRFARGKRLLDYGTGTGYFTDYMAREGYAAEGIEIDAAARAYGVRKFGITVHEPAHLFTGYSSDTIDVITLWHVLEHLYDPLRYLRQFREILTDEGLLIIAVPNHQSSDAKAYGPAWAAYDVPRHLWHFSPVTLREMVAKAGFQVKETFHMPLDPFYVSIMSQRYAGGGLALLRGAAQGLRSFANSLGNPEVGSSVIYVCTLGKTE